MLILEMLVALFAVLVIMFLIQYRSYNLSQKQILSDGTTLTEENNNSSGGSAGLPLPLNVETGYAP